MHATRRCIPFERFYIIQKGDDVQVSNILLEVQQNGTYAACNEQIVNNDIFIGQYKNIFDKKFIVAWHI